MTARELAEQLRDKLPGHTFKAVIHRAKILGSEIERRQLLAHIAAARERSEALDRQWVAS